MVGNSKPKKSGPIKGGGTKAFIRWAEARDNHVEVEPKKTCPNCSDN